MSGFSLKPFPFGNFTGGLTDEYLSASPDQYQRMDNILLNEEGNPVSRPGSAPYDAAHARLPTGDQRVGLLINYGENTDLLAVSGSKLYVYNSGWTEVQSVIAGDAFLTLAASDQIQCVEWKKQLLFTTSKQTAPMKAWKGDDNLFHIVTAGLPIMAEPDNYVLATDLARALTRVNYIRTQLLGHLADFDATYGTPHIAADVTASALLTAPAATDLPSLITLTNQLVRAYHSHFLDATTASQYHSLWRDVSSGTGVFQATLSEMRLTSTAEITEFSPVVNALNDLVFRFNTHISSAVIHANRTGGTCYITLSSQPFGQQDLLPPSTKGPSHIELSLDPIIQACKNFGTRYAAHRAKAGPLSGDVHANADTVNTFTTPTPFKTHEDVKKFIDRARGAWIGKVAAAGHETDTSQTVGWAYHVAKGTTSYALGPSFLPSTGTPPDLWGGLVEGNYTGFVTAINTLKNKFNAHVRDATAHRNPATLTIELIAAQDLEIASYGYAFTYVYTYTVGGLEFEDESAPLYRLWRTWNVQFVPLNIYGIPPLANTTDTAYDVTKVKIRVYRTINGGRTYYRVAELANGTTEYMDTMSDAELQGQPVIYADGGTLDNDPPPKAKFIHAIDNYTFYANFQANGADYAYRLVQAAQGDPDSVPGSNYCDLPSGILGMSSSKSNLIAFTATSTFRIDGRFGLRGEGSMAPVVISDQVGLAAGYSPVQIDAGVVFFGTDGVYFTDGYSVKKISRDWLKTYLSLVSTPTKAARVLGVLDKQANRVWWTTQFDGASTDNESLLALSLKQGLSDNACFQTASNEGIFDATAVTYYRGQLIRGDSHGYVLKHDNAFTHDVNLAAGTKRWIRYDLRTIATDFGTANYRKWVPNVIAKFKNLGNLSVQINSINDDGKSIRSLTPIRWRGKPAFGDVSTVKFGSGPGFTNRNLIEAKRRFPTGTMRCSNKQLQLTLAKVVLTNSDEHALATLDPVAKTATLASGNWPLDLEDQMLTLENDGYVKEFAIVSAVNSVLTFSDAEDDAPLAGVYKWEVKGYPKDERLQLLSLILSFAPLGQEQPNPTVEEAGGNE